MNTIADIQLETAEPKKLKGPKRYVKYESCLVVVDKDGKFVSATGSIRTDVQVVRLGRKRPTLLRAQNYYIARNDPTLRAGIDYLLKPKREGKKVRKYVEIDWPTARKLGITETLTQCHTVSRMHHRIKFPPNILASHRKYSDDDLVLMNELLMQGAVWCELNGRHFLAVLPK